MTLSSGVSGSIHAKTEFERGVSMHCLWMVK